MKLQHHIKFEIGFVDNIIPQVIADFENSYNEIITSSNINNESLNEIRGLIEEFLLRQAERRISELLESLGNGSDSFFNPFDEDKMKLFSEDFLGEYMFIPRFFHAILSNNISLLNSLLNNEKAINQCTNNELNISHDKIVGLRKKVRRLQDGNYRPNKNELKNLFNLHRKKNGSPNYAKIGRALAVTHHTAKKWCELEGLK